jgi:hypothetical protein
LVREKRKRDKRGGVAHKTHWPAETCGVRGWSAGQVLVVSGDQGCHDSSPCRKTGLAQSKRLKGRDRESGAVVRRLVSRRRTNARSLSHQARRSQPMRLSWSNSLSRCVMSILLPCLSQYAVAARFLLASSFYLVPILSLNRWAGPIPASGDPAVGPPPVRRPARKNSQRTWCRFAGLLMMDCSGEPSNHS